MGDTVWATQQIADLYEKARPTITEHIQFILDEGELTRSQYVGNSDILRQTVRRMTSSITTLMMILAVGFRVKSPRPAYF